MKIVVSAGSYLISCLDGISESGAKTLQRSCINPKSSTNKEVEKECFGISSWKWKEEENSKKPMINFVKEPVTIRRTYNQL